MRCEIIRPRILQLALVLAMSAAAVAQRGPTVPQWTNSIGMKFVRIPPGRFMMGTPPNEPGRYANETLHEVRITRGYLLGAFEVTRGQFRVFVDATGYKTDAEKQGFALIWTGAMREQRPGGSWRDAGVDQTDDHPVVDISWNDAVAFAAWLSRKEGRQYRLPTEAEWEYAARAGTRTAYPWGNNPDDGGGYANAADQSASRRFTTSLADFSWDDGFVYTAPVGTFMPNPWGLYDMIGNALEWCADYYGPYAAGKLVNDPQGPARGDENGSRVLRGGSWTNHPGDIRTGFRHWHAADYQMSIIGFRLALNAA
jgi:sulfatase modifying factor 1